MSGFHSEETGQPHHYRETMDEVAALYIAIHSSTRILSVF